MKEQEAGKRLAPSSGGGKKAFAAAGAAVAVLAAGYLALCVLAGGEKLWPHTSVMGVDVSGMTVGQARAVLEEAMPRKWADQAIELYEPGSGIRLYVGCNSLMEPVDLEGDLRRACQGGSFLTRGARFAVSALSPDHGLEVEPTLRYTLLGQARMESTLNQLTRRLGIGGNETSYEITEDAILFRKGRSDTRVDEETVRERVTAALTGAGEDLVEVPLMVAPPAEPDFAAIHGEVYAQVSDAYLDRESGEIVPSVTGRDFDVEGARKALADTADGGVCRVELKVTEPAVSTETLTERLFRDILGDATTRVTGTTVRIENVGTAAGFIDGTILFPGEEFSFNQVCSPYTVDHGYGKATAYVNGLSKDTVAGGICQASSTLYWAVLKANLEVVERSAHRYEPSYIRGGLDATVYGDYGEEGGLDFRFRNNGEHPIKIESYVDEKRYLHMTIYGTDTTGIHGEPYSANRVLLQAAKTLYEADASVPQGTTRKDPERTGYDAVSWDTYQKLVDAEGNTVSTQLLYTTRYKVRNAVILYNPADLELWNIDPATGIRNETPQPVETGPEESVQPGETASPGEGGGETGTTPPAEVTPSAGEETPSAGEETVPPADPVLPPEGETEPVQTEAPTSAPILPPGTAVQTQPPLPAEE